MIRHACVAGQFYPASPADLKVMLSQFIDEKAQKEEAIGVMIPHAGYPYSGRVTGAVLSRVKLKDTVIIIGPNHTGRGKPFSIMTEGTWQTPLGDVPIDSELAKEVLSACSYLQEDPLAHQYEHCIEVQLPFIQHLNSGVKIVPIVFAWGYGEAFGQIGKDIAAIIKKMKRDVLIVASSDMSHYEKQEAAQSKDSQAIEAILDLHEDELWRRVTERDITMCGFAPVVCLISAAKELGAKRADLVLYQTSGDTTGDYSSVVGYAGITIGAKELPPLVRLAKKTVETYVREGKVIEPPAELTPEMQQKAGVFVSIHKFDDLRGCIGTFEPTRKNIAQEVIANAIGSATKDPRFERITPDELVFLNYSVDVLTEPVAVTSKEALDPKKYGLIVECGWRRGLLLPDLEGVDTVDQQIGICCQKAGIRPNEVVKLYCFQVKRYK
ncbi:MAG: AmmeMemoRadiSam system protein B [Chloroflexi bacterium]|nr:AmmeMemoRadiSam system protein B [Chloroflexota bacterium]